VAGTLDISEDTRNRVIDALGGVVQEPRGTAYWTRLKDIHHGGKTGTSQVIRIPYNQRRLKPEEMNYIFRDHSWFVAFAPVENPEIAVAVLVEHGGHGSTAAAPIARDVIQKYFDLQKERLNLPVLEAPPMEQSAQKEESVYGG
jgi:penicillin-binding protein 2